jgi:hypothetical protein
LILALKGGKFRAMTDPHLTMQELEAGLEKVRQAPKDGGCLELIVRRPQTGERDVVQKAELSLSEGLVGDNWKMRGSTRTGDGTAHPDLQLTIMNARAIALLAREKALWQLAGDQLFIDMDLSAANVTAGTRLEIGSALIEVTNEPHTGCKKFAARFGDSALQFVNSTIGRELRLRGINAKVVRPGLIQVGDVVKKA